MQADFFSTLNFALGITAPIFILVVLGIVLKRVRLLDERFIDVASKLVFTIGLPTLLFINIVQTDPATAINLPFLGWGLVITLLSFFVLVAMAIAFVPNKRDRGVFVQGSFRGNLGIVGLAFCLNAYGETGSALTSLYMAAQTILYNILAAYILTQTLAVDNQQMLRKVFLNILKNPIIIGIALALFCLLIDLPIHPIIIQSGDYVAAMTLPLALLCIGGSISLKELRQSSTTSWLTVSMKLIALPLAAVLIASALGYKGMELGILFLMSAAPTATASYVMVQAMRGNGVLAANIVVLSTLASVVTVSTGIVVLKGMGKI